MELPKIETFYKLNLSYNHNDSDNKNQSHIDDNLTNNRINSSNKIFLSNYYSTKYIPRNLTSLKLSKNILKSNRENCLDNFEIYKYDIENNNRLNKINSYRELHLSEKYNKIKSISTKMKENISNSMNLINKKIKIIKSSDNLYVNKNFNTNNNIIRNRNRINILFEKQLNEKNKEGEKDEDKTILPPKILKKKKNTDSNVNGFKYTNIIINRNEINKDLKKKKTIDNGYNNNKKYHEHYIFFNNSFLSNDSWKNNILKNILPKNINYILKEEELKKIAKNNVLSNQEREKNDTIKIKKKFNIFRNIYINNNRDSFFNSEINHFLNKYKNNNKLILSRRNEIINKKNINSTKIPKNIVYNFCSPIKKSQTGGHMNNSLIKNISYDSMINVNSLFNIKNYN